MLKPLSVLGYAAMAGGLIGMLLTRSLFSPSPFVVAPQAAAVALMIWARVTFGRRSFHLAANLTQGGLVTTGPYRFIRHPIYTAVCLFVTPAAVAHPSWSAGVLCAVIWAGAAARMYCEEHLLSVQYPEYRAYAAATSRMIPFVF